ncbi:conserved hypothetical protein [Halomicrobium mukohataei DSM 12286]|uniref:Uncharacterized protein n=2 Tax=Halomicrobium mukohataei TaxID=57705 RepID=C7P1H9_HALMD|nr:conserved hypothetical protein [Halomicrobium mukohataei DSM 12286]
MRVMDERDVFDLLLVVGVSLAAYVHVYGLADPLATADEIAALLLALDVRVYLVLGSVTGVFFVAYLVVYLPQKDTNRSVRRS